MGGVSLFLYCDLPKLRQEYERLKFHKRSTIQHDRLQGLCVGETKDAEYLERETGILLLTGKRREKK
ncbi:hypothetical protein DXB23_04020 [Dorea sp. OM02-2LB]|nr:hypothetical protein DXB23_04020 [Dorea sp. OM02-2LB]